MTDINDSKLKTGLFYTDYYTTQKPYLHMNPKDTEVFLNDYKFMKKILDYDLNSLEDWCKGLNDSWVDLRNENHLQEEKIYNLEKESRERDKKIEMLEKKLFNLQITFLSFENKPLTPIFKNRFDLD